MPEDVVEVTEVQEPTMESAGVFYPHSQQETPKPEETPAEEPKSIEKPAEEPKEEKKEDAPDIFSENSKTAFINEDGSFNSEKLTTFMDEKDSFYDKLVFDSMETSNDIQTETDHEVIYRKKIFDVVDRFDEVLQEELDAEQTAEQTIERLKQYFNDHKFNRDKAIEDDKRLDSKLKKYTAPLNAAVEQKIQARIETVTNRLAPRFKDVIPGLTGEQVLDKFALDPKYGGEYIKGVFEASNKNMDKMLEDERKAYTDKWEKSIQTSGKDMARAAKFGEAMWIYENLHNIIQQAIQIGAGKANMQKSAIGSTPKPNNGTKITPGMHPQLAGFFGRSVE